MSLVSSKPVNDTVNDLCLIPLSSDGTVDLPNGTIVVSARNPLLKFKFEWKSRHNTTHRHHLTPIGWLNVLCLKWFRFDHLTGYEIHRDYRISAKEMENVQGYYRSRGDK